jgi:adenylate cyclase
VLGAGASPDCSSLQQGTTEDASILFADFVSFKDAAHGEDPDWHLRAVNELLGEMGGLLARHSVHIISHLGRGFMAVARGRAHAARAVAAAVEMHKRLDEINIPRQVLGLTKLDLRIAVNTGPVVLGNVGTYWKLDFTATGPAVEMASLLLAKALPGGPCISEETHTRVEKLFRMSKDSPSTVHLEGIGAMSVWHVVAAQEDVGASAAVVKRR